jgi:hypothetical protein
VRLFIVPVELLMLQKSWVDISVKGGYDTTGVTVATTVLNNISLGTIEA